MDIEKIRQLINSITDKTKLYLIEVLSSKSGFFSNNGMLLYLALDESDDLFTDIDTAYLKLQTHVNVHSIENNQSFSNGYYNIIGFLGTLNDPNAEAFVRLCAIHAKKENELAFKDFFYSLISLFQLPVEQSYLNAVGLYGELKFMQYVKEEFEKDISAYWHVKGTASQYDFSNGEIGLEIKSTSSLVQGVHIKHQQIFGKHPCFLVVVECRPFENGETIENVLKSMEADTTAFNSINYSINIEKELKRISPNDFHKRKFETHKIEIFDSTMINPFDSIPDNVEKLNYELVLTENLPLDNNQRSRLFDEFTAK